MKKMLFFLAFTIAFTHGFGQNLDSLVVVREVDSLIKVSQTFIGQRNFDKALEVNAAAEKIALEKLGRESALYGSACFNHGRVLYLKGDLLEAEKWYIESKVIREQALGKEHPDYAASLNNLGALYLYMGDYEKAEAFFLEAKDIREKSLGKDHPDYATSLNNLAFLYSNVGDYEKAESFHLESKAIREKALGKNHPDYAASLNNLGILYWNMGQYEKAEQFYLESKDIREKALGKDSPDYAGSLTNLAVLYMDMGQYEKAEPLCLESSIITEKSLGKDHPDYAKYLNNLGILYWNTGQYEKAEPLFLESKSIREKAFGKDSPDYAASLTNLAILYSEMGSFEKAEQICLESLTITEKSLGKDHPDYAASLTSLAILYHKMGDYEKAGPFYLESKSIREKALGKYHREYAMSLNNLASWYSDMGQYEKAENLYLESLTIKEKTLGKEHPDYAMSLINLAILYREMGMYEKAERFYKELVHLDQLLITKSSKHLSEQELNNYVHTFSKEEDQLLSFISIASAQAPRLIPLTYSNALFHKGFLLNAVNQVKRLALTDSASTEKYYLLKSCHRLLAGEYARPVAERDSTFIVELEEKANILEKDLTHTVAGYKEAMSQVTWKEVHHNLKSKEAAVEFIHYRYYNEKNQDTDSTLYAALLLLPGWSQPRMVTLFEQKTIQPLLNAANTSAAAAQLYAARGGDKKRGRTQKSEGIGIGETANLYQLIWQPLDSLLEGAKTVYFSPSGMLHRLNLGAVPIPGSKQILADRYQLVQVGSTRQLVVGSGSGSSTRTAALFGALKFDMQTTVNHDTLATTNYDITSIRRSLGAGRGDTWNYLPGTEKEIRNIAKTLGKAGYAIQSSTGYNGTEAAFKSLGANNTSSPTVLHIATHGFFFPDPKDTVGSRQSAIGSERQPVFKTSDNPLMRSGLILSGANRAWAGGKTPEGQEDGILTAYEISQMNLSNTELVVLSACETGLGDVSGNEGVYGLQRAFKIAGAKYLVMSLWQVSDKETSEFMSAFYHKWLEEKIPVPDAFRAAQSEMRERFGNPYLWAGFVLVE